MADIQVEAPGPGTVVILHLPPEFIDTEQLRAALTKDHKYLVLPHGFGVTVVRPCDVMLAEKDRIIAALSNALSKSFYSETDLNDGRSSRYSQWNSGGVAGLIAKAKEQE